jgi:hypothetical protein
MKTVIEMAREAGIEFTYDPTASPPKAFVECWADELERLVELARADEREACAKVCESLPTVGNLRQLERATMKDCAIAIRNRSNT